MEKSKSHNTAKRGGGKAGSRVSSAALASKGDKVAMPKAFSHLPAESSGEDTAVEDCTRAVPRVVLEKISPAQMEREDDDVSVSSRTSSSRASKRRMVSSSEDEEGAFKKPPPKTGKKAKDSPAEWEEVSHRRRKRDTLPDRATIREEMVQKSTADMSAEVLRNMELVSKMAETSKNLKGSYVRSLRLAARRTEMAVSELQMRTGVTVASRRLEETNHRLTEELLLFKDKLEKLEEENRALRRRRTAGEAGLPLAGVSAPETGAGQGAKVTPKQLVVAEAEGAGEAMKALMAQMARMEERFMKLERMILPSITAPPSSLSSPRTADEGLVAAASSATQAVLLPPPGVAERMAWIAEKQRSTAAAAPSQKMGYAAAVGRRATLQAGSPSVPHNRGRGGPSPPAQAPGRPRQQQPAAGVAQQGRGGKGPPKTKTGEAKKRPARPPGRAAVTLTVTEGSRVSYAEVMRAAREKVNLPEVGITEVIPRKTLTGGMLLEIPGPESAKKAEALAGRMREALDGLGVKVSRPVKQAELRVTGLDESVTPAEVAVIVAAEGGCTREEIKVGTIKTSPLGRGTLWLRCPLSAARKIAAAGRLQVGWVAARVAILEPRPLQCYRCLETGHVRQQCAASQDRGNRCYSCGAADHIAATCTAARMRCPLCSDLGRPDGHRLGGKGCFPPTNKGKKGRPVPQAAKKAAVPVPPPAPAQGERAPTLKEGPPTTNTGAIGMLAQNPKTSGSSTSRGEVGLEETMEIAT